MYKDPGKLSSTQAEHRYLTNPALIPHLLLLPSSKVAMATGVPVGALCALPRSHQSRRAWRVGRIR